MLTFQDLIVRGGTVNFILMIFYVLTMLIVFERLVYFIFRRGKSDQFSLFFDRTLEQDISLHESQDCLKFKKHALRDSFWSQDELWGGMLIYRCFLVVFGRLCLRRLLALLLVLLLCLPIEFLIIL